MPFDPLEWLEVAASLGAGNEAARRTAVGRYYYAVFLKCHLSLSAQGLLQVRQSRDDHRGVVNALARRRQAAATALMTLSRLRELADYEPANAIGAEDVQRARVLAERVKFMCESDW